MKFSIFTILLFLLPALGLVAQIPQLFSDKTAGKIDGATANCGADNMLRLLRQSPDFKDKEERMNREILQKSRGMSQQDVAIYTLPVVFHIINDDPSSISDQKILDGLKDLNDAFSKSGKYSASLGADTKINFCLAQKDPDGGITTGITRTKSFFSNNLDVTIEDGRLKNLIQWNPLKYINIWYIKSIDDENMAFFQCGQWVRLGYGGYATLPMNAGSTRDGIVVTLLDDMLAHEMGHYLGLYHTFEGLNCSNYDCNYSGDKVCDTPPDASVYSSSSCENPTNSCNSDTLSNYSDGHFFADVPDQITNFMDYGNKACRNQFTEGQAIRMRDAIATQRKTLLENECLKPCPDNIVANFSRDISYPLPGNSINFTNTTVGASAFQWLLDDTIVSTSLNFSHQFVAIGKYKVTLKAFNGSACFASYTDYVIVNCGVTARFYIDKREIASKKDILLDSIYFNNTSVNATSYKWLVSNDAGMAEHVESEAYDLNYIFLVPGNYQVRLIATDGGCTDTTETYNVPVADPTLDGVPFRLTATCYQQNKVKVDFCIVNYGYAPIPKNTEVNFYDGDPKLPTSKRLSPTFYFPFMLVGGSCYNCYSQVLNVTYAKLTNIFLVFNDAGTAIPVALPNTALVESDYTNNTIRWQAVRTTVNLSICAGESYDGYSTTGTFTDTLLSVLTGCDSIRLLNLKVLPVSKTTVNASICQGENYAGHTASGTYVDRYKSANGCDSTRTLNLIVKPVFKTSITAEICEGEKYEGYNASGTYSNIFKAKNGCDSIRTLTLTVKPKFTTFISESICIGESYAGHVNSGTYVDVYKAANGCDSTRTLNLIVKPIVNTTVKKSICEGQQDAGYTLTGDYVDVFTAANGCDSTRTLQLTVLPNAKSNIEAFICDGENYAGHSFRGTFIDVYKSSYGCDSTRTLHLTVKPVFNTSVTAAICEGESCAGHNKTGNYTDVYQASNGCDSTRRLDLTVKLKSRVSLSESICEGKEYAGHTKSGTYIDVYRAANGCDSIRTLMLTVIPKKYITITKSICNGASFEGYTTSGTYVDKIVSSTGCDSIRTLLLTVNPNVASSITTSICEGELYAGHSTTGVYTDVYKNSNGCDSTRTLYLTVKKHITTIVTKTICEGENVENYTATGVYKNIFKAANGCDSTRNLYLTVNPKKITRLNVVICSGESYLAGGRAQTLTGIYFDTLNTYLGCDSVIITSLVVKPLPKPDLGNDKGICIGNILTLNPGKFSSYLWQDGSSNPIFETSTTGTYSVTVKDMFGCSSADTIQILKIFLLPGDFLPVDTSLCRGNIVPIKIGGFLNYSWSTGSRNNYLDITKTGTYSLLVTDVNGCKGADSIKVVFNNCVSIQIPNAFTPNNDSKNEVFKPFIPAPVRDYKMQIWNRWGQLVFETKNYKAGWDGRFKSIDQPTSAFLYKINLTDIDGIKIEKMGSFVLIR